MHLTIRVLGVELLHLELAEDSDSPEATDCTTYPVGFTTQPRDQRWEAPIHEG